MLTYRELREYLNTLLPEELDRPVLVVDYQTQESVAVENIVQADGLAGTETSEGEIQEGDPVLLINCYTA